MSWDPYPSDEQLRRLRHASISASARDHFGVQGGDGVPGHWEGLPPWRGRGEPDDDTCPVCGKDADCRTRIGDTLYYHHDYEPPAAPDMEAACIEEVNDE